MSSNICHNDTTKGKGLKRLNRTRNNAVRLESRVNTNYHKTIQNSRFYTCISEKHNFMLKWNWVKFCLHRRQELQNNQLLLHVRNATRYVSFACNNVVIICSTEARAISRSVSSPLGRHPASLLRARFEAQLAFETLLLNKLRANISHFKLWFSCNILLKKLLARVSSVGWYAGRDRRRGRK